MSSKKGSKTGGVVAAVTSAVAGTEKRKQPTTQSSRAGLQVSIHLIRRIVSSLWAGEFSVLGLPT